MQSISQYYPRGRFCRLNSGFGKKIVGAAVSGRPIGRARSPASKLGLLFASILVSVNKIFLLIALILLQPFYGYGANIGLPGTGSSPTSKQGDVEKVLKEAKFLVETEQYLEAIIKLRKAIQMKPDYVEAYELLAKSYHGERMMTKAIRYYKKALELKPNSEEINYNLAIALIEVRKYKDALEYLEKVVNLNSKHEKAKKKIAEIKVFIH